MHTIFRGTSTTSSAHIHICVHVHIWLTGALLGSVDASGQAILRLQADADGSDMQASGQGLWKHLRLEAPPRR